MIYKLVVSILINLFLGIFINEVFCFEFNIQTGISPLKIYINYFETGY